MAKAKRKTAVKKKSTAKKAAPKKAAVKKVAAKKKVVRNIAPKAAPKAAPKQTATAKPAATKSAVPTMEEAFAFGNNFMQQMFEQAPNNAFSGQGAEQISKASDAASRSLNDAIELGKENVDACVESGNIAAGASQHVSEELMSFANKTFSEQVEISKELFSCRTLNDMFDLQNKIVKQNLDGFFNESVKLSEMVFEAASNAAEPIQERIEVTAERVNKRLSEAA